MQVLRELRAYKGHRVFRVIPDLPVPKVMLVLQAPQVSQALLVPQAQLVQQDLLVHMAIAI